MKRNVLFLVIMSSLAMTSCEKQEVEPKPLASLQITNAIVGIGPLQFGTNAAIVANNSWNVYSILAGNNHVKLVTKDAPNTSFYDKSSDFVNGGLYSLFLTGTSSAVESVMIKEDNILPHNTDDVFGVRFINLSVGSEPISINILDVSSSPLVESLAYKTWSGFIAVSAKAEEGAKVFEFRNAENGTLISSFTVPDYDIPRFRNITLVFAGTTGAPVVFRINNY